MKHLSHIDLASGELQNAAIQNITKPPLNPRSGRLYYDVTDKDLKVFSGGKWESCISKVLSVNGEIGEVIISPSVLEFTSISNFPDEGKQGKIYLDGSSNLLYRWNGSEYIILSSVSATEYDVISDVVVGSIEPGDTVNQGSTLGDFIKQLLMKTFYPTFTNSSVSASTISKEVGSSSNVIAVGYTKSLIKGDVVSGVWNPSATQGDRTGNLSKVWVNGVDNGTSLSATIIKLTSLGSNNIPVKVDYSPGIQPKDSLGVNYLLPLPAGSLTTNANWSGFYYRTAIAGNFSPSAIDVRNSYAVRRSSGGILNLVSGTVAKRFDIFVPQGSSLTSAIDEGNLNLDITSEFILQSNFSGLDANGDEVLYKHYLRQIGNPYTSSSNLKITVT